METQTETTQYYENLELLKNPECGELLADIYDAAVKVDPRLMGVIIAPYSEEKFGPNGSSFALGSDFSESGKHEIHVRIKNIDEALKYIEDTLDKVPGIREDISKRLELKDPKTLNPMQVHAFVMLHELGHITEYFDNDSTMAELRQRQKREKDSLPIGNIASFEIIDPSSTGGRYIRERWELYSELFGVQTIEELAQIRHSAYSKMTSEVIADDFATKVLSQEPDLLEKLANY